jgi:transcriptional regulator with XRE-family HTH domain
VRHTDDPEIDQQILVFGEHMRAARHGAGLSQVALSQATRLDRAAISFLERAARSPDLSTMVRVARALAVKPSDLLEGIGSSSPDDEQAFESSPSTGFTSPASRLGANLRAARTRAGLSQEALAYEAAVDRAAISVYERGGREPNLRTTLKLARALGVPPAALFEGVE